MNTRIAKIASLALAAIACLLLALPLAAAPPGGGGGGKVSVTAAYPPEAFQGEELIVTVSGSGFDAGSAVSYLVTGTSDASQVQVLSVQYISSSELKTYIRLKTNAVPTDYDIEVQTTSGRKGKGTTLFRVKQGGPPPPPPPLTEPSARYWHNFTGNGSTASATSRLYLFGGTDQAIVPDSFWYFNVAMANWTLAPTGSTQPSARQHAGFSCGGGLCVAANGGSFAALKDTWVYAEASATWSELNCKRFLCPSARWMPTMAYDSARGYHLLFGGRPPSGSVGDVLSDTYTFSNATGRWTQQKPSAAPSGRRSAAATFVAGPVNRVVLFGGQIEFVDVLCDMWSWTGSTWQEILQTNPNEGPCLHSHSLAWDGARLIVTGGYVDYNDTPNDSVWTFAFTPDGKAGTWTYYPDWSLYFNQCAGSGVIRPGAFMAYDRPSGALVYFGGVQNVVGQGAVAYQDLNVCTR